jgi:nifR3 family TIM-barrel protein
MAGVTNAAFRQLCAQQAALGLAESTAAEKPQFVFVCEMITAGGIAHRIPRTFSMLQFFPGERRAVQLYGTDPAIVAKAAEILCAEFGVELIDLNFGCPVPKVTRKGGGGALPWKLDRTAGLLGAAVKAAEPYGVPVTVKTRIGIDAEHTTYLDLGRIAQDVGIAAVTLHARSVQQAYSGQADWEAIATLVNTISIPVVGNGDLWEAADAARMRKQTGCASVAIGRGCLGRPWLFRDLARGPSAQTTLPRLGEVNQIVYRHAELLAELNGEKWGLTDLRKHMAWYYRGFPIGGELRRQLALVSSLADLRQLQDEMDASAVFPTAELGQPRGRQGNPRDKVHLPYGWLDSRTLGDAEVPEDDTSGG